MDNNQDGIDTDSQIAGDPPPPQNGACPHGGTSPITHTHSCWVFIHNNVHDNNNGNTPEAGDAAAGPIGTGMTVAGGRNDTVMDNTFSNNGAWGVLFLPYPDSGTPSLNQKCAHFGGFQMSGPRLRLRAGGERVEGEHVRQRRLLRQPDQRRLRADRAAHRPALELLRRQHGTAGSAPANLEQLQPTCGVTTTTTNGDNTLVAQVECDSRLAPCPAGSNYPAQTGVRLQALPKGLPTMANPCAGVPSNPWCPSGAGGSALGPARGSGGGGGHGHAATAGAASTAYRRTLG